MVDLVIDFQENEVDTTLLLGSVLTLLPVGFGRRLSVVTVGFARPGEDFSVLHNMADRPRQFDSNGRFFATHLNPEAQHFGKRSTIVSY